MTSFAGWVKTKKGGERPGHDSYHGNINFFVENSYVYAIINCYNIFVSFSNQVTHQHQTIPDGRPIIQGRHLLLMTAPCNEGVRMISQRSMLHAPGATDMCVLNVSAACNLFNNPSLRPKSLRIALNTSRLLLYSNFAILF